ncbi:hypothetical protein B0H12DRAFT_786977 [Mycena haematopus]|nr:hypothetical protein B0H12DRAFT_786977 [Mycena haematopus]
MHELRGTAHRYNRLVEYSATPAGFSVHAERIEVFRQMKSTPPPNTSLTSAAARASTGSKPAGRRPSCMPSLPPHRTALPRAHHQAAVKFQLEPEPGIPAFSSATGIPQRRPTEHEILRNASNFGRLTHLTTAPVHFDSAACPVLLQLRVLALDSGSATAQMSSQSLLNCRVM